MTRDRGSETDVVRLDVTGDLAAVELVELLRWAKPRVTPLEGESWRIAIPAGIAPEDVVDEIRAWLRAQDLPAATVYVAGTPQRIEAAA